MGCLTASKPADKLGRKKTIMIACFIFMSGMIIQITTRNAWYQIVIGRIVEGLGVGALSVLAPMYETESAPTHIREVIVRYLLRLFLKIFQARC